MRLTLRTLLAYLDDILEPPQAKEIGIKLTESKFASDLVQRIREVMRRRRLSAPPIDDGEGGVDANMMAEYLDNTLSPEKVTEVEKRCLESDMHLAEAAACHQVLTMVLGEPVDIAPESRRRMYGLVSQGSGDNQAAVAAADAIKGENSDRDPVDTAVATESAKGGTLLPDYLIERPLWRRVLAAVTVLVVLLLLAIPFLTDPTGPFARLGRTFGWNSETAKPANGSTVVSGRSTPNQRASASLDDLEKPSPDSNDQAKEQQTKTAASGAMDGQSIVSSSRQSPAGNKKEPDSSPATGGNLRVDPTGVATATPGVKQGSAAVGAASPSKASLSGGPPSLPNSSQTRPPEAVNPAATSPAVATIVDRPSQPATAGSISKPAKAVNPKEATADSSAGEPLPEVKLVSKTGVLLGYDSARDDWFVVGRPRLNLPAPADGGDKSGETASPLDAPGPANKGAKSTTVKPPSPGIPPAPATSERRADQLVAPEPFDNTLEFGDGLCRVSLLGGTSVRLLAPSGKARFGIELRQGRILLHSGSAPPGNTYTPLVLTINLSDGLCQLEMLRPETVCGIEVFPSFPTHVGQDAKEIGYRGGLYAVSGDVRLTESVGRQRTLAGGRWISLTPTDRAVATDVSGATFRAKGAPVLSWLTPESRRIPAALAKIARDFEAELLPDQPISPALSTVAKSDRPKLSELAVRTLALINQYQTLAEVLAQVPHEESVQAAVNGLRTWLPLAPDHSALLARELKSDFPPRTRGLDSGMDDADCVLRLLWGYNIDDARDRATSNQLVEWLDHDKLAVRVLAIDQIAALTGQTLRYRPAMKAESRRQIKKEWERYVVRNKGLLPP